jgi:hypothetical protein
VLRELELEPEEETRALLGRIRAADIMKESGASSASVPADP